MNHALVVVVRNIKSVVVLKLIGSKKLIFIRYCFILITTGIVYKKGLSLMFINLLIYNVKTLNCVEQDLTDYKDWQDSFNMIVSDFLEAIICSCFLIL
jgi:hypothetical protein